MADMGILKEAGELKRLTAQTATLTWSLFQVTRKIPSIENVATRRKEIDEVECLLRKVQLLEPMKEGREDMLAVLEEVKDNRFKAKIVTT